MPGPEKRVKTAVLRSPAATTRPTADEDALREQFLRLIRLQLSRAQTRVGRWGDLPIPSRTAWGDENSGLAAPLERDLRQWQRAQPLLHRLLDVPYVPPAPPFRGADLTPAQISRRADAPEQRLLKMVPELQNIVAQTSYEPSTGDLQYLTAPETIAERVLADAPPRSTPHLQPEYYDVAGYYNPERRTIWMNPVFSGAATAPPESVEMWRQELSAPQSATAADLGVSTLAHEYGHALGQPHSPALSALEQLALRAATSSSRRRR